MCCLHRNALIFGIRKSSEVVIRGQGCHHHGNGFRKASEPPMQYLRPTAAVYAPPPSSYGGGYGQQQQQR